MDSERATDQRMIPRAASAEQHCDGRMEVAILLNLERKAKCSAASMAYTPAPQLFDRVINTAEKEREMCAVRHYVQWNVVRFTKETACTAAPSAPC